MKLDTNTLTDASLKGEVVKFLNQLNILGTDPILEVQTDKVLYKFDVIKIAVKKLDASGKDRILKYLQDLVQNINQVLQVGYVKELDDPERVVDERYFKVIVPVLFVMSNIIYKLIIVITVVKNVSTELEQSTQTLKQLLLDTTKLLINIDSFDVSTNLPSNPTPATSTV
jgi:hypothetical protein